MSASEAMEADTRSEEEMEKIEEKEEDKRRKLENIIGDVLVFY